MEVVRPWAFEPCWGFVKTSHNQKTSEKSQNALKSLNVSGQPQENVTIQDTLRNIQDTPISNIRYPISDIQYTFKNITWWGKWAAMNVLDKNISSCIIRNKHQAEWGFHLRHTYIWDVESKICKSLNGRLPGTLIVGNMLIAVSGRKVRFAILFFQ